MNNKIQKSSNPKSEIVEYLESHGIASEDELAEALHMHILDVLNILFEMEEKGIVRSVPDESSPDSNGG
jgi:transcription initiation factor IIE alpha subunit